MNELTFLYINGVMEIRNETTGAFLVDERAGFRPAGVGRFARSRGGHLCDDSREGRVITIQQVASLVTEFVAIEQGMDRSEALGDTQREHRERCHGGST